MLLPRAIAVGFVASTLGVLAVVACNATSDPRAGSSGSSGGASGSSGGMSSGASGTSASGGLDAAPPTMAVDCGPSPGAAGAFTKQALLGAAAECASWHACVFQNAATALRTSFRDHAAAPADAAKTAAAQAAWRGAMNEWSKMELFQFGPVGPSAIDKYHGRGLRTFVHPWPDLNRCQVETQAVQKGYQQGWDVVFPSSRGLFAVEYALFYPGADTACLANSQTAQIWATQSAPQLAQAKNDYATAVVDNIVALALEIRNVWAPTGENFKAKLLAFDGYGSEQETLNVVAWSLLYPEQEVKDLKLGSLAGFQPAPNNPETPFARIEADNIRANLRAFRSLFQGCGTDGAGIGFDDWLIAAGQQQLANDLLTDLNTAITGADALPAFSQATPEQFVTMYNAVKPLSNRLKTMFFGSASTLNLKLPATVASDTD